MLTYHCLQKEDLNSLKTLHNEQYIYDPITEEILDEKIFGEKYFDRDLNFIVKNQNTLAGFASGLVYEYNNTKTGWIKLIASIDQKLMGPVLIEIFDNLEYRLREKGATVIRFLDSFPNYFTPGIDPRYTSLITLLHKKHYNRRRDNVNMKVELSNQNFDTGRYENQIEEKYNITIQRASTEKRQIVFDLINKEFEIWQAEITLAYEKKTNPLHIAILDNKVIAFSNHSCNNIGTGWFGPMGTTEKARGKGIGEILLKRCLKDLQEAGFSEAIIPWVGPIGFYFEKCNAEVERTYWNYIKEF